jgi:hypothetical protein
MRYCLKSCASHAVSKHSCDAVKQHQYTGAHSRRSAASLRLTALTDCTVITLARGRATRVLSMSTIFAMFSLVSY